LQKIKKNATIYKMQQILKLIKLFFSVRDDVQSIQQQKDEILELAPKVAVGWGKGIITIAGLSVFFIFIIVMVVILAFK